MNPELLRNLWLELTPMRRWGVPFTVAMVMVLTFLVQPLAPPLMLAKGFAMSGLGLFALFSIWGATKAMNSVTGEITSNTWDMQRLAGHRPWDLLVGKVLGSTSAEWYGAGMALGIYLLARAASAPLWMLPLDLITLVSAALLAQAFGVFASLAGANTVRSMRRPPRGMGNQGAGLILALVIGSSLTPFAALFLDTSAANELMVHWWIPLSMRIFLPLTFITFFGWVVAGAHRLIRAELQEPVRPWTWLAFLGFLTLYLYPLTVGWLFDDTNRSITLLVCTAAMVFGAFVPMLLLGERKDVVRLRSLAAAWRRGDRQSVLTQLPLWTFTLVGYVACVAALGVLTVLSPSVPMLTAFGVALGVLLLMLRDIGLVMAVHLAPRPSRDPGMVTAFLFAIFYVLMPILAGAAGDGFSWLLMMFVPVAAVLTDHIAVTALGLTALAWGVPLVGATWAVARPRIQLALREADD
ncbi:MAG: hypothetical protein JWM80_6289 [Cyanobacteria bacterium RYN_339]|nr:hypothetical protein [Cyanobacteria bacterium RYN_339]